MFKQADNIDLRSLPRHCKEETKQQIADTLTVVMFEGKSCKQWAQELDVNYGKVWHHLTYYGNLDRIHEDGQKAYYGGGKKCRVVDGKTTKQWAEELGVTLWKINYHLKRYGNLNRLL